MSSSPDRRAQAGATELAGPIPARTEAPGSAEELATLVAACREARHGILALGGGTEVHVGNPPDRCDVTVRTERLAGVAAGYSPADLVLTVGAGTRLAEIQEFLAAHGQRLPLEAAPGASIGGVVAAATAGKRRLSCGTPRDWLVGFQAVAGTGRVLRGGGRVVKNVTGYDLCKLFTGSRGRLGILTELSFKVAPVPEVIAHARVACASWEEVEALRVTAQQTGAAWIELSAEGTALAVAIGFEGLAEDVDDQVARIPADWHRRPGAEWGHEADPAPEAGAEPPGAPGAGTPSLEAAAALRLGVLPDRLVPLLSARRYGRVQAHLGSGLARAKVAADALPAWREAAGAAGGWSIVERGPAGDDVYSPPRPEWELGRRIKQVFDPDGIMAPGRGPGRI